MPKRQKWKPWWGEKNIWVSTHRKTDRRTSQSNTKKGYLTLCLGWKVPTLKSIPLGENEAWTDVEVVHIAFKGRSTGKVLRWIDLRTQKKGYLIHCKAVKRWWWRNQWKKTEEKQEGEKGFHSFATALIPMMVCLPHSLPFLTTFLATKSWINPWRHKKKTYICHLESRIAAVINPGFHFVSQQILRVGENHHDGSAIVIWAHL